MKKTIRDKFIKNTCLVLFLLTTVLFGGACNFEGGAAVGTADAGEAYEYGAKRQMDRLEEDYKAGNITTEEYLSRKKQIEEGSIIY